MYLTDPANNTTHYGYDSESNLTDITDANQHNTHFDYDALGRVTKATFPSTLYEMYGGAGPVCLPRAPPQNRLPHAS